MNKWDLTLPILLALEPLRRPALRRVLSELRGRGWLSAGSSVLDVGSGTGFVAAELLESGCAVTAVEPSRVLGRHLHRRFPELPLLTHSAEALSSLDDHAFDYVVMASVLHGMPSSQRRQVHGELQRVARKGVVFFDYHPNRNLGVAFVEWLEGGAYFEFLKRGEAELREHFTEVQRVPFSSYESAYLCR